ncbi:hypothetical protein ACHAXT_004512 [Thalassiosira profunda]
MPPYARPAAAALLANVASSAWAEGACFSWHAAVRRRCRIGASASCPAAPAHQHQRRAMALSRTPAAEGGPRRRCSLAAEGSSDAGGVVSSVRRSLRQNLIQPHLLSLQSGDAMGNGDGPTLVLLLAVSGGCDSIALFHTVLALTRADQELKSNQPRWLHLGEKGATEKCDDFIVPCELHVAHFNHEQRGETSDGDEAFVRDLCQENGVPFHCFSWSEIGTATSEGPERPEETESFDEKVADNFTQDVARNWRRQKLKDVLANLVALQTGSSAKSVEGRWGAILTAHHRDDADETILLKLLRGSHLTNIRGMEASSSFEIRLQTDGRSIDASTLQSSPVGYFAKPLLDVRKRNIIEYLESNALTWREDESNSSSKYRRNKVRNELMPLLRDIAGGEHALEKRLGNLEQQSRDISRVLSKQSEEYLQAMPSGSVFHLPNDPEVQFDVVQEEALHMWLKNATCGELQLPYDQMLRIRDQLHNYPKKRQWTLDVGSSWKVQRNGHTLAVTREEDLQHDEMPQESTLPWTIVRSETGAEDVADAHELHFAASRIAEKDLVIEWVKDSGNIKFTPPWRKGRSAMKIKEFLRGQKVPLHLRDDAIVLRVADDSSRHALAVYLEGTGDNGVGRWIVNADFSPQDDGSPQTTVVVRKTSRT